MSSEQRPSTDDSAPARGAGLGTFTGVFTPSILTILGIILFLRLGFVVGNGGLRGALLIITIATVVSVLTSISLAAIATNIEVKGGGDYYLISRTLGLEFGGALGIVLFLAQAVSIAFYAIGFGEGAAAILGIEATFGVQAIAAAAVGALFLLAWLGADWASRFQFGVMAILIGALLSFYVGSIGGFDGATFTEGLTAPAGALPFWATFAIFFPAITGFTQGVSMSGDLKQPSKSLPIGTFAAIGLSTIVYVTVAILFAGSASSETLIEDTGAMRSIASFGWLIDAGVIAATLSSAIASFLGAPRILQSLAADRIFPFLNPFAKGHGPTNNPRRGVLLSLGIALVVISLGDLNVIAPVVSMFFLISYGLLNYATYFEASAQSPSFRPRFRFFDRRLSLLGALGCLGVIVAINPVAGAAAVVVVFGIYQFLRSRPRPERWADSARSHYFQRAKESITAMSKEPEHDR
ncbi:MAG: amino acid permease, partial [Acidimicrobiia bacterium]|nr:amino acid permease [Acidimicrobiia bacterium]